MNYQESNDAIFAMFVAGFVADATTLLGYAPLIVWPFNVESELPTNKFWMRVVRKGLSNEQAGPASDLSNPPKRRFNVNALLILQLFYPRTNESADTQLPALSELAKNSIQGKHDPSNALWVRDTTINELNSEESWFRTNIIAEFEYQEIK